MTNPAHLSGHTHLDSIPENYLNVTYLLTEKNGITTFTVKQGDYNKVEEGAKRYIEGSNNGEGWNPILMEIKNLAEKYTFKKEKNRQ